MYVGAKFGMRCFNIAVNIIIYNVSVPQGKDVKQNSKKQIYGVI